MEPFKFVEHTADAEFYAFGKTLEEAFVHAAYAVTRIMVDYTQVKSLLTRKIMARGKDNEALLYNFVEELIFLLDAEDFVTHKVQCLEIKKDAAGMHLEAELHGDLITNSEPEKAIKAATYNNMEIGEKDGRWVVHMVVDI